MRERRVGWMGLDSGLGVRVRVRVTLSLSVSLWNLNNRL